MNSEHDGSPYLFAFLQAEAPPLDVVGFGGRTVVPGNDPSMIETKVRGGLAKQVLLCHATVAERCNANGEVVFIPISHMDKSYNMQCIPEAE